MFRHETGHEVGLFNSMSKILFHHNSLEKLKENISKLIKSPKLLLKLLFKFTNQKDLRTE